MSSSATVATAATPSQQRELQQQRQLLVQEKEKHVRLLQQQQQMRAKYNEKVLAPQEQLIEQQHQQLLQQQQQMRATSLEKEIEKKRQRQLEQENPNRPRPTSITKKALENPKFIESIMTQPIENIDKCLHDAETSVFDQLYPDLIDYTGEHLIEAFRFKPILKRYEINGIDVERLKKLKAGLNDDRWSSSMIKRAKAEIESNEESRMMFQAKKCSMTITQQEHIEQELLEDKNNKNNNNNNNNVFNEMITYYNGGNDGGGSSDLKQRSD